MARIIFSLLILCAFCPGSYGQTDKDTYPKLYLKPAAGFNIPLTRLMKGDFIDNLIAYDDNASYWQLISAIYMVSKNWGVELNYMAGTSGRNSVRADAFNAGVTNRYGNEYFVFPDNGADYFYKDIKVNDIERGCLGVVYKMEKGNFVFMPRLFVSVTSFYTDWGRAYLKEKNTNLVLKVDFSAGKRPRDHFAVAPGFTFAYKLSNRIMFNIDMLYTSIKTDIKFIETTTNQLTGNIKQTGEYDYSKRLKTFTVGGGLIIVLNLKKN
jgi:hypothetical protein